LSTTADGNGIILLDWLRTLGWNVEVEREETHWVGVARHSTPTGDELRVGGCAAGLTSLVWALFVGAVEQLEGRDRTLRASLRAA
jgi:hypothetical protein